MNDSSPLSIDHARMPELLQLAYDEAVRFLNGLDERPVNRNLPEGAPLRLPRHGLGAGEALALLTQTYEDGITGSAGPRYFGFVTGGSTPAAIMGDWLTTYKNTHGMRAAFSNWRTTPRDVEIA